MNSSLLLRAEAASADKSDAFPTLRRTLPTFSRMGQSGLRKSIQFGRRHWRKFLILLAVLALLHTGFDVYASMVLNRELAEIRAQGEPVALQDVIPPDVPDAENAALDYARAVKLLDVGRPNKRWNSLYQAAAQGDDAAFREIAPLVTKNQAGVAFIVRGGLKQKVRFPVKWKEPAYEILLPHYASVRSLACILNIDARLRAQKGDMAGALRDVRAIAGMADHCSTEPILIGFLVARAVEAISQRTLAQILEVTPLSAAEAHAFEASLPKTDWNAALVRALNGERVFGISTFEMIRTGRADLWGLSGPNSAPPVWLRPLSWFWRPWFKLDEVYTLRAWKRILGGIRTIPTPVGDNSDAEIFENLPRYAIVTRLLMPVFARVRRGRDVMLIKERQQEVALALSVYRREKGEYPATLQEAQLVWDRPLPQDLYRKQPFIYRRTGQTFLLYSVGPDGGDDQGEGVQGLNRREISRTGNTDKDDITWNSLG